MILPVRYDQDYPELLTNRFKNIDVWTNPVIQKLFHQLPYGSADEMCLPLMGVLARQNAKLTTCTTNGHVLMLTRDVEADKKCNFDKKVEGILSCKCIQILA